MTASLKTVTLALPADDEPISMVYSPETKDMYVSVPGTTPIVAVIDGANKITTKIADSHDPALMTYDAVTHDVYVADFTSLKSGNITVINSGNKVAATIKTPEIGVLGFVNPTNGEYYIGSPTGKVYVYSAATVPTRVKTLNVGPIPAWVLFDPSTGDVMILKYVSTAADSSLVVYSSANALLGTVTLGLGGVYLTYDSTNTDVYVPNYGTDTVTVIT